MNDEPSSSETIQTPSALANFRSRLAGLFRTNGNDASARDTLEELIEEREEA